MIFTLVPYFEQRFRLLGMAIQIPTNAGKEKLKLAQSLFGYAVGRGAEHARQHGRGLAIGVDEQVALVLHYRGPVGGPGIFVPENHYRLDGYQGEKRPGADLA